MTTLEIIGHNLSKYRKIQGYTQESLANELGMSVCNLRKIEHGTGNPEMRTLIKLANHLNITVADLLKEDSTA